MSEDAGIEDRRTGETPVRFGPHRRSTDPAPPNRRDDLIAAINVALGDAQWADASAIVDALDAYLAVHPVSPQIRAEWVEGGLVICCDHGMPAAINVNGEHFVPATLVAGGFVGLE